MQEIFFRIPLKVINTKLQGACMHGRIQDFKLGGALKKIVQSGGRRENCWGNSCEKSRFYAKKSYFFQFQGGRASDAPVQCSGIKNQRLVSSLTMALVMSQGMVFVFPEKRRFNQIYIVLSLFRLKAISLKNYFSSKTSFSHKNSFSSKSCFSSKSSFSSK